MKVCLLQVCHSRKGI